MKKILFVFVLMLAALSLHADTKGYFAYSLRSDVNDRYYRPVFVAINTDLEGFGLITVHIDWNGDSFIDDGEIAILYSNVITETSTGTIYEGDDWSLRVGRKEVWLTLRYPEELMSCHLIRSNLIPKADP